MSGVNIKKQSYLNDNSFNSNHLHVKIHGKDINYVIINTLRRTLLADIPCYAFNPDNINISKNTSVFNNDYMRNRLENIPIPKVSNDLDLSQYDKIRKFTRGRKSYETDEDDGENFDNLDLLNFYVEKTNDKDIIISITSDDCEFYKKGKKIKSIYSNPILICKLKPKEEIKISAVVDKGIGLNHSRYSPVSICCYDQLNENEFIFKFENRGQFDDLDLLDRCCRILIFRLNSLKDKLSNQKFSKEEHGKIILENEDHTIGNLLSRSLQDHKNIEFAAYMLDHLLIRKVTIEYITNGGKHINQILNEVFNNLIKTFTELRIKFGKLKL